MATFEQVKSGIAAYLDTEVMPAFHGEGWKRVLVGTTIALALNKSDRYFEMLKGNQMVQALGVIDADGDIDVETLVPIVKEQLSKESMTLNIPMLGDLKFTSSDVDKLHDYIKTAR